MNLYEFLKPVPYKKSINRNQDKLEIVANPERLENTDQINIFISPNNSGKSLLLRQILKSFIDDYKNDPQYNLYFNDEERKIELKTELEKYNKELENYFEKGIRLEGWRNILLHAIGGNSPGEIKNSIFSPLLDAVDSENLGEVKRILTIEIFKSLSDPSASITIKDEGVLGNPIKPLNKSDAARIITHLNAQFEKLHKMIQELLISPRPNLIYIPNIRTVRTYDREDFSSDSIITTKTKTEYFQNFSTDNFSIIDGQAIFMDFFEKRNDTSAGESKLREYQKFLSENFFDGKEVFFITSVNLKLTGEERIKSTQLKVKIGDEPEQYIYNLGDGIQQIIMLTYPLFMYDNGIVFIEEPEINLHAGIQKKLLEIYSEKKEKFVFFVVTHSNFILEKALELNASVYRITKKGIKDRTLTLSVEHISKEKSECVSTLEELGISPSSLLFTNGVIWVEGPSDVIYIRKWLELYQKEHKKNEKQLIEGLHYSFQVLSTAIWKYAGFWNDFENKTYESENVLNDNQIEDIINILEISRNNLLVIDRDTDFDVERNLESQIKKPKPSNFHKNGKNKAILLSKVTKKDKEQLSDNEGETNDKLLFWVNKGTVETYLDKYFERTGNKKYKKSISDIYGYTAWTENVNKVKFANEICNKANSFSEFAEKDDDLYKKVDKLYNTILGWNK